MATYKGIQGYTVQSLASDPTPTADYVGQIWYNSASNVWKLAIEGSAAWASGNVMNTNRRRGMGAGTQGAGIAAGGYLSNNETETFNGTTWTSVNDLNTGRDYGGNNWGTNTASLYVSGAKGPWPTLTAEVEKWDGTSWSVVNDVQTARRNMAGAGTVTAAVGAGGYAPGYSKLSETYNGTSWTEVNTMNTGRTYVGSGGAVSTAALCLAGEVPGGVTGIVEKFDGTCWSEEGDLNTARASLGGAGTSTLGLAFGGSEPAYSNKTESFDGTTWTAVANLGTAISQQFGCGTQAAALSAGGDPGSSPGSPTTATELWNDPVYTIKTVTTS